MFYLLLIHYNKITILFLKIINNLSEHQRKMLRDQYFEYLRDGLKPRDAIEKAFEIVLCFSS